MTEQGACIHSITKKIGLREAKLVVQPLTDAQGTSFFVQVNGVPIYSNGSNWCPADHFVPSVTADRYRTQLNILAEGNQNTVRYV
jgi:beta-mannosidase